jgi:hypothetical protein
MENLLVFLYLVYDLMMFTILTAGPGFSATDDYRIDFIVRLNRDFTRASAMETREPVWRV